mmetsp:Transcript_13383/g.29067  ORF Transcript_13383/g.29067 Transcript_13383/m.29067 type:complete len:96 (-) Transcript_13383:85-372(-)
MIKRSNMKRQKRKLTGTGEGVLFLAFHLPPLRVILPRSSLHPPLIPSSTTTSPPSAPCHSTCGCKRRANVAVAIAARRMSHCRRRCCHLADRQIN